MSLMPSQSLFDNKDSLRKNKGFLYAPDPSLMQDSQKELTGDYEYFGSVTSRPLSKS